MNEKREIKVELNQIVNVVLLMILAGLVMVFGSDIVAEVQGDQVTGLAGCNASDTTACGTAYNVSSDTLNGITGISSKWDTVGLVIAAALLIGLLYRAFQFRQ